MKRFVHKAVNDQVVKRAEVDSLLTRLFRGTGS